MILVIPRDPSLAARLAHAEVSLAAARLGLPEPTLIRVNPTDPEATAATIYARIKRHHEIHAYIDASPSATTAAIIALTIHALRGNQVEATLATRDPQTPHATINLAPIQAAARGLKPSLRQALQHLASTPRLTPHALAEAQGVSVSTATRILRTLKRMRLAVAGVGGAYRATPWARLILEALEA